jgi:hypothetical protein
MYGARGVGGGFLVMDDVAVASQAEAWSQSLYLGFSRGVSLGVRQKNSTGTPIIQVDWQSSFQKPTTEAASDATFVVPTGLTVPWVSLVGTASDATGVWLWQGITPPKTEYGRVRVTGLASNGADTTVDFIIHLDEGP